MSGTLAWLTDSATPKVHAGTAAYLLALGVAILSGLFFIAMPFVNPGSDPGLPDESAYYLAARRLLEGQPLYTPMDDPGTIYRYAPWFAVAWIPLALLPESVAYLLWEALLLACAVYVIATLARMGRAGTVMAAMALPLIGAVPSGNAGTMMLALLMRQRADPWSVGLAGSLKLYPLALCAGYVAERRWRDCTIAVGLTAVLWLPTLWIGLDPNVLEGRREATLPLLTAPLLAVVAVMAWRGSRWTWLAVAGALPLAVPHYVSIQYTWIAARRLADPIDPEIGGRPIGGRTSRHR